MIYRFRSPATGDVVMLGPSGDEVLRILGREPSPKGILEPAAMPAAMAALQAAVAAAEAARDEATDDGDEAPRGVGLWQRAWPLLQMMQRAHAADEPITWGV